MKIEDVSQLFDFLGGLSIISFLGLTVLLAIIIFILIAPYKKDNNITLGWTFVAISIVLSSFTILYIDARKRHDDVNIANYIKQQLISSAYYGAAFQYIHLPTPYDDKTPDYRGVFITELIKEFPEQFSLGKFSSNGGPSPGVILTDFKAIAKIDSLMNAKAERTASVLAHIMITKNIDSIPIENNSTNGNGLSIQKIDNQGYLMGASFFNALIGRHDIYPIYNRQWAIIAFTIPKK